MDATDPDLICAKCNKIFKTKPLRLPCDKVACKHHFIKYVDHVKCSFCKDEFNFIDFFPPHAIEECPIDVNILKKWNLYNFDKNQRMILEHIKELTTLLSRPYIRIHDYFGDLINRVDIKMLTASIHIESTLNYENIIPLLNEIERKCLGKLNSNNNELQATFVNTQNVMDQAKTLIDQVYDNDQMSSRLITEYKKNEQILKNILTKMKTALLNLKQVKQSVNNELKAFRTVLLEDHILKISIFKPINKYMIYVNRAGFAKVFDLDSKTIKFTLNDYFADLKEQQGVSAQYSLEYEDTRKLIKFIGERYFVIFGENSTFTIWDKNNLNRRVRKIENIANFSKPIAESKIISDEKFVFLLDRAIKVYNIKENDLKTYPITEEYSVEKPHHLKVYKKDRNIIFFIDRFSIHKWNIETGKCLKIMPFQMRITTMALIAYDFAVLVTDFKLYLWNCKTYEIVKSVIITDKFVKIKDTPFEKIILIKDNKQVCIYDYYLEFLIHIEEEYQHPLLFIKFLPSRLLALEDDVGNIKFFNIQNFELLYRGISNDSPIYYLNQLDQNRFVVCTDKGKINVWDLERMMHCSTIQLGEVGVAFKFFDK